MIGDRWGVSDSETSRAYPCDDFIASPTLQAWRGVSVRAPAEAVWPWVAQVRIAPYSYDWIDNRGRRSPRELAGLPEPRAGDRFSTAAGRPVGRIVSVDHGRQLTGSIAGAFMSYVLVPREPDGTRLLLKVVARTARWAAPCLSVGDLIMARRQLLNLRQLAEQHHRRGPGPQLASRADPGVTTAPGSEPPARQLAWPGTRKTVTRLAGGRQSIRSAPPQSAEPSSRARPWVRDLGVTEVTRRPGSRATSNT